MAGNFLIVEDEIVLAMHLEDLVLGLPGARATLSSRLEDALATAQAAPLDGAILDVNVSGRHSFPVADALKARGIPYVFVTGYGNRLIPPDHAHAEIIEKPFSAEQISAAIARMAA